MHSTTLPCALLLRRGGPHTAPPLPPPSLPLVCSRDCGLPLLLGLGLRAPLTEEGARELLAYLDDARPWRLPGGAGGSGGGGSGGGGSDAAR